MSFFAHPKSDVVAGVVVFLVALPLCLGIAVASGVPPVAGLVAGIVGGLVVPLLSRSPLSVTGPAAGLTSIVIVEVERLGGLQPFLAAVVTAGLLQIAFGVLRLGRFSTLVPSAAIQGMLAAIGITIVIKQLPVAFSAAGPAVLALLSLGFLFLLPKTPLGRVTFLPPALVVVIAGTLLAPLFAGTRLALAPEHFVDVPTGGPAALWSALTHPAADDFFSVSVWIAGVTIALVASIETLLSLQAVDRLDPLKRTSPPDRELLAQGTANAVAGLLGGLPVTAVIVRSGANVAAGAKERLSAFVHGVLLLVAVVVAARALNAIPLACLAAVLLHVGVKLARPGLFVEQARHGAAQLVPFLATIVAVLALDLLKGVVVGVVIALLFALREKQQKKKASAASSSSSDDVKGGA